MVIIEIIVVVFITVLIFLTIWEASARSVYGKIIKDPVELILKYSKIRMYLLDDSNTLLLLGETFGGGMTIYTCNSVSCKYYIMDVGTIARWSKSHRLLNRIYKDLKYAKKTGITIDSIIRDRKLNKILKG